MLVRELKKLVAGDVTDANAVLETASRDAGVCVVRPRVVVSPKSPRDVEAVVRFVSEHKAHNPGLAITPRAAGTDMSGGPLGESIVLDFTTYARGVRSVDADRLEATALPGTYYRDFEKETLRRGLLMPAYTSSREICTIGGMVANDAGGEKSLGYGKTGAYTKRLKVVLADGNETEVRPLGREEIAGLPGFLGERARSLVALLEQYRPVVDRNRPDVTKNSAGYNVWGLWDGQVLDLPKLFAGAQGTLGVMTEVTMGLVRTKKDSKLLVVALDDLAVLSEVTQVLLPFGLESLETYDDLTLKLSLRYFLEVRGILRPEYRSHFLLSLIPDFFRYLSGGFPKLVLLAEVADDDSEKVDAKLLSMREALDPFPVRVHLASSDSDEGKYWAIRRESFNLLRKHMHKERAAPFIDDVAVNPKHLPEFLPKLRAILDSYGLVYTVAGHDGNGNLHIFPLMDMHDAHNRQIIPEIAQKVFSLVAQYRGSTSGEHNDGIIRTPYLSTMYDAECLELFRKIKELFDPQGIFNPGKKVPDATTGIGTLSYLKSHLATS